MKQKITKLHLIIAVVALLGGAGYFIYNLYIEKTESQPNSKVYDPRKHAMPLYSTVERSEYHPETIDSDHNLSKTNEVDLDINKLQTMQNLDPFITSKEISFTSGEEYPICGRFGDVPLHEAIEGHIKEYLTFCFDSKASLNGTNILQGKITLLANGWAQFDIKEARDIEDKLMPARTKFLRIKDVITPFVLTDEIHTIPLKYAGLVKVLITPNGFREVGEEDPCSGSDEPELLKETNTNNVRSVGVDFNFEKSILLKNTDIDINKHCGT